MIFTKDDTAHKVFATLPGHHGDEHYECAFEICENPLCRCDRVTVQFSPVASSHGAEISGTPKSVTVDIKDYQVEDSSKGDESLEQDMAFHQKVQECFRDEDYHFLYQEYFLYKQQITATADIESLQVEFPIEDIERNNTMIVYIDVIPYAEQFTLALDGEQYLFFDQYCVKLQCPCTDVVIGCVRLNLQEGIGDDVAAYTIDYKKRRWNPLDEHRSELGTVGKVAELKRSIEAAYPTWYDQIRTRHSHLKTLYRNCLKAKGVGLPRILKNAVGRNDACPCGSGKKFKKCCLNKTQ